MDSYIKNRNRLVNVLDNCAKIIRCRADYDDSKSNLSLRISSFSAKLRNEEHCHDTVSALFSKFEELLDLQKKFQYKTLSTDTIKSLSSFLEYGEQEYEKEVRSREAALNTMEFLQMQKENTLKEISSIEADIVSLSNEGDNKENEITRMRTRLSSLKSSLEMITQKIKKKMNLEDETKELQNKMSPLTSNSQDLLKELTCEKKRLNVTFYVYAFLIIIVIGFLIGWETYLISSLYQEFPPKDWMKCIILYLPIPISAGLLWAFIYQMNRAQRQLMRIAERIHTIKYKNALINTSTNLYSDGLKNEDHVAKLIDGIMKSSEYSLEKPIVTDKDEQILPSLPLDKIIELTKAITGK